MDKKINYTARDFTDIKNELLKFSNQYYPELSDDFNDSSVGAWFLDLVAAVGDELNYAVDRSYQETNVDSANLKSTVMNQARSNGLKVPGAKASTCEIKVSCVLPTDSTDISSPDWTYAPIFQSTSVVGAGDIYFQPQEDVNFNEQFNSNGYSNRTIVPSRNSNGNITGYTVSKTCLAVNGTLKVYKKVIYSSDLEPFMSIVLPESNVLGVESIIFKETNDFSSSPSIYEYYIDSERYRISDESVMTYRFFECDSLADQYRFGDETKYSSDNTNVIDNIYKPSKYDEYPDANDKAIVNRYYRGEWKPLKQKFITEYTDNGYLKIIFGAGNTYDELPSGQTQYSDYIMSNIINNDMLGVLPKEGWTMMVLYRIGGGDSTNLAPGAINKIVTANVDWANGKGDNFNGTTAGQVITSLTVTNTSTALAGKDAPSTEEIKALIKYNSAAQNRAVVVNDYKLKLMQMPAKYGAPFRNTVIEENNKIEMDLLGIDANGKLNSSLPQTLVENITEWMEHYKQINDYIEIKSGKIYNIGFECDIFIDKNYNLANVVSSVISEIQDYFDVNNHLMGEDIFIGDLEKEINSLDGVISLIKVRCFKIWNGSYSVDKCPLPETDDNSDTCGSGNGTSFNVDNAQIAQIDLDSTDYVLYSDYNAMYEIKNPTVDIQIRPKTR